MSKTAKILWPWLSRKLSLAFYVLLEIENFESSHFLAKVGKVQYLVFTNFKLFLIRFYFGRKPGR